MRDPPLPVEMRTCPICEGYKTIMKHDLDAVMKEISNEGFSNETSILSDQNKIPHQVREIERREAQNKRSPPPPADRIFLGHRN